MKTYLAHFQLRDSTYSVEFVGDGYQVDTEAETLDVLKNDEIVATLFITNLLYFKEKV